MDPGKPGSPHGFFRRSQSNDSPRQAGFMGAGGYYGPGAGGKIGDGRVEYDANGRPILIGAGGYG